MIQTVNHFGKAVEVKDDTRFPKSDQNHIEMFVAKYLNHRGERSTAGLRATAQKAADAVPSSLTVICVLRHYVGGFV